MDVISRARCGTLAAHGLTVQQIADTLLLSIEQVKACEQSQEYKNKYAETAEDVIQRQIDMDEGWDVVETKAIAAIIQTLDFNRDPKYALFAAKTANAAKRRSRNQVDNPKVIHADEPRGPRVISITMNKTFINTAAGSAANIEILPKQIDQPRKQADLPSPKAVENLLAPVRIKPQSLFSELEEAMNIAGVFKDE